MKVLAEREAERLRKAEELRNKRREASFVAYEGDKKLYKVNYGDPRKTPPGQKKTQAGKKVGSGGGRSDSAKSNPSEILTRRRKETIEMRRRLASTKINS